MSETKFSFIYDEKHKLGDVCLFRTGTACVTNEIFGVVKWFDNPKTGHKEALSYIERHMTKNPRFVL